MHSLYKVDSMIGQTHVISAGMGFWDTTHYPLGGKFARETTDLQVTVTRDFRAEGLSRSHTRGCTHAGRTADGRTVVFEIRPGRD